VKVLNAEYTRNDLPVCLVNDPEKIFTFFLFPQVSTLSPVLIFMFGNTIRIPGSGEAQGSSAQVKVTGSCQAPRQDHHDGEWLQSIPASH
jgi:hypothetical protein